MATSSSSRPNPAVEKFRNSIVRSGARDSIWQDFYVRLLHTRWLNVFFLFAGAYLTINVVFACIYLAVGDCISNARPGVFLDAFAFSVQTLSTVGYGHLHPAAPYGDIITAVELFWGLLLVATATGIVFSKFSRPRAGIAFSDKAVICRRNGTPYLMIRLANTRGNDIVEGSIRLTALVDDVSREGHRMRRLQDLHLERSNNPIFLLSWLVLHRIDEKSPLHGLDARSLRDRGIRIIANVTGMDGGFMQTVYAYTFYDHESILFDTQFVDIISFRDGKTHLDLTRLHDVAPAPMGIP